MKTALMQQVYPDLQYLPLLHEFLQRHAEYCTRFGIDYHLFIGEDTPIVLGGWDKVRMVRDALKIYDLVVWLDADAIIFDTDTDLREVPLRSGIGATWFTLPDPHYNTGVMYFKDGRRTRKFMKDWLDGFPGDDHWHEQQVFNDIADKVVTTLPATWNASHDHNWMDKPVVASAHGMQPIEERLKFLRSLCL